MDEAPSELPLLVAESNPNLHLQLCKLFRYHGDLTHAQSLIGSAIAAEIRSEKSCTIILQLPVKQISSLLTLCRMGLQNAKTEQCTRRRPRDANSIFEAFELHTLDPGQDKQGKRDGKVKMKCWERTGGMCSLSATEVIDVAHILPFSCTAIPSHEVKQSVFWLLLVILFGIPMARYARALSDPKDSIFNVISVGKHFHYFWDCGSFVLEPCSDKRNGVVVIFRRLSNEINWTCMRTCLSKDLEQQHKRKHIKEQEGYPLSSGFQILLTGRAGERPHPLFLHIRSTIYMVLRGSNMLATLSQSSSVPHRSRVGRDASSEEEGDQTDESSSSDGNNDEDHLGTGEDGKQSTPRKLFKREYSARETGGESGRMEKKRKQIDSGEGSDTDDTFTTRIWQVDPMVEAAWDDIIDALSDEDGDVSSS